NRFRPSGRFLVLWRPPSSVWLVPIVQFLGNTFTLHLNSLRPRQSSASGEMRNQRPSPLVNSSHRADILATARNLPRPRLWPHLKVHAVTPDLWASAQR